MPMAHLKESVSMSTINYSDSVRRSTDQHMVDMGLLGNGCIVAKESRNVVDVARRLWMSECHDLR
jgi:hypothetical protein